MTCDTSPERHNGAAAQPEHGARRSRTKGLAGVCLMALIGASACTTNSAPTTSSTTNRSTATAAATTNSTFAAQSGDTQADAAALVTAAYRGTFSAPPSSGPPAVKGKNVWIISCFQVVDSCALPAKGAAAAAQDLGWKSTVVDGQLSSSVEGAAITQAVGARADAIVLVGIDCFGVQGPLAAARAAGVTILGLLAFDCDDPGLDNPGQPMFDLIPATRFAPTQRDLAILYGRVKAAYAITATKGKAVALDIVSPTTLVLHYISQGFQQQLRTCHTCRLAATVEFTNEEILSGQLKDKLTTALQQHPDVDTLEVPFDPLFQLAVTPAVGSRKVLLLGGEGLPANVELVRSHNQTIALATSHAWIGYAGMDMLNRHWAGEKVDAMQIGRAHV